MKRFLPLLLAALASWTCHAAPAVWSNFQIGGGGGGIISTNIDQLNVGIVLVTNGVFAGSATFTNTITLGGVTITNWTDIGGGGGGANWTASGTTSSTLAGTASAGAVVATNHMAIGSGTQPDGRTFTFSSGLVSSNNARGLWFKQTLSGSSDLVYPYEFDVVDDGYTGGDSNGSFFYTNLKGNTNNNGSALYFGNAIYALTAQNDSYDFNPYNGQSVTIYANNYAYGETNFGVAALTFAETTNRVSVGVAGAVHDYGYADTKSIGGYFETSSAGFDDPLLNIPTVVLIDNKDSGYPLITARTNNGTQVFGVAASGSVSTASSYTSGAPSGGTAAAWKFGSLKTCSAVTMVVTNYIEVDISGTLYKLPIITATP